MRAQCAGGRSRYVVRTRETFVPLVLFALALVGALLMMRQPGADAPANVARAASPLGAAHAASDPGLRGTFAPSAESAQSAGEREADRRDADSRDAERGDANGDSTQPQSTPTTPLDAQPTRETVGAAIDTLKFGSPEDRVLAIRSLSGTARNGAEMARVRSSLHLAATDDDPDVAARAQEEYEALVERDDR